jgi:uncharacterized protein YecE (DUF72 family)
METPNASFADIEKIAIGTSGYFYSDWKGVFYPPSLPSRHYFSYYSNYFSALELNFSFYRIPAGGMLRKFLRPSVCLPDLSIKAFRGITHIHEPDSVIPVFLEAIKPLVEAGRIQTILFQFPYSFIPEKESWKLLEKIAMQNPGITGVVEFRHISWFSDANLRKTADLNLSVCALDMPDIGDLPGTQLPVTHQVGYMRFHGRNAEKWWNNRKSWERYDYLYPVNTLSNLLPALRNWIDQHRKVYLFFNNHYRGQAIQNAQTMMAFLAD